MSWNSPCPPRPRLSCVAVIKLFRGTSAWPATPAPNSYWVEPGRLLAGEYPGAAKGEQQERVRMLTAAGFTSFIDLTDEGELPAYHSELTGGDLVHRRFAIVDHGIPDSPATMRHILAAIAGDLADGRRVYLHCRAGIGRTGMTVGCFLISQGLDGTAALDKLQTLWQRCARSRSWPSIPETEEQIRFVRQWTPAAMIGDAALDRVQGALIGLAAGEGLAIATPGGAVGGGAWLTESKRIEHLATGADTAMTIALAQSLLEQGGHDARDQLQRYLQWTQQPDARNCVPAELKRVLAVWQWSRKLNPGSHDPRNLDPHPLARTLAVALFAANDARGAAELAAEVSRATLQSPLVLDACRIWAATLMAVLKGESRQSLLEMGAARDALSHRPLKPPIAALLRGQWESVESTGGALALLSRALNIFRGTQSFEGALREAVRAGDGNLGALVGTLAGAFYGHGAIPLEWRQAVPERQRLEALAGQFAKSFAGPLIG